MYKKLFNSFFKSFFYLLVPYFLNEAATRKWSNIEWVKETYGNHIVPVEAGKNYVDSEQHEIPFGAYLDYVMKKDTDLDSGELPTLYLAQYDLLSQIQELNDDIISPFSKEEGNEYKNSIRNLGKGDLYSTNSWISGPNTVSNTHRDPLHNIFCQVVGQKYWRLFFPETDKDMYPNHSVFNSNTSRVEKIDCSQDEFRNAGFPNFYNVKYKESLLQSGDNAIFTEEMLAFCKKYKDINQCQLLVFMKHVPKYPLVSHI